MSGGLRLEGLSWEQGQRAGSLDILYQHARRQGEAAIAWYLRSKRPKKRGACWLRVSAILLATVAGLIPILAAIFVDQNGTPEIPPAWSSVALGLAAACVALDRFFGFSSAWMRFIWAELEIRTKLQDFQMEWEQARAGWQGAEPSEEELHDAIGRCRAFVSEVDGVVKDETARWINEFRQTLKEIDRLAESGSSPRRPQPAERPPNRAAPDRETPEGGG